MVDRILHRFILAGFAWVAGACESADPNLQRPSPKVALEDKSGGRETYDTAFVNTLLAGEDDNAQRRIMSMVDEMLAEAVIGIPIGADVKTVALHLNWFVHTHLYNAEVKPSFSIEGMLVERSAICGGSAIALQLLARRLGYETRTGGLYGVPLQGSHVITEIKWDDEWHFLDPTFGVFFTADGTLAGKVLSFEALMRYRHQVAPNAFYAMSDGRLGRGYVTPKPESLDELYSKTQVTLLEGGNYALFLDETKAGSIFDTDYELTFPYLVDLSQTDRYEVGESNMNVSDIAEHVVEDSYFKYDASGLQYLGLVGGGTGPLIVKHHYRIAGMKADARMEWRTRLLVGDPADMRVDVRSGDLENIGIVGQDITVTFISHREELQFSVSSSSATTKIFDFHFFKRL